MNRAEFMVNLAREGNGKWFYLYIKSSTHHQFPTFIVFLYRVAEPAAKDPIVINRDTSIFQWISDCENAIENRDTNTFPVLQPIDGYGNDDVNRGINTFRVLQPSNEYEKGDRNGDTSTFCVLQSMNSNENGDTNQGKNRCFVQISNSNRNNSDIDRDNHEILRFRSEW